MASLAAIIVLLMSTTGAVAQQTNPSVAHPPVGTSVDAQKVKMTIVNKHVNYTRCPDDYRDPYINSPKSANIHPDGTKYYVNSLEGCATVVYDMNTHKRLKVIKYDFKDEKDAHLWSKPSEFYPFTHYTEHLNTFMGKPVESTFSHGGRYLWIPFYRRTYDINAQDPSAIAVIDTRNDSIVKLMETGPLPKMVACSHDGKHVAITHWGNNTVGLVNVASLNPNEWYHESLLVVDYVLPLNFSLTEQVDRDNKSGYCLRGTVFTPDDRYLLSLTMRYDGSSRFGRNNRYGTFPSVAAGWRINQEKFMSDINWIDNLKLRASWGQTGNQEIANIARYTLYVSNYGEAGFGGQSYGTSYDIEGTNGGQQLASGFKRNQLGNDDLKWETTTQTNLGFDFGFFHNALYGSFEWYHKKTTDILVYMPGIGVMGEGSSQWINAGEMVNKGLEFNVGYRGNIGNFQYDIAGNIGTYRNEITKLPETIAANGTFGGNGVESVVGHPMGSQVGYVYDGVFKSQEEIDNHATQNGAGLGRIRWKDLNGDNVINEKDQKWIYSPVPDFTWGLNIYLQYKNLDFTMFWQGVQGVDVISDLKKETDLWSGLNISNLNKGQRLLDAWSPTNMGSNIPAISTMDNNNEKRVSSFFVENGSYAKLRTVQLGYNFPKSIAEKLYMSRLRMYISAQNLLTIKSSKFTGVDPENANFGYPIPVNITFGLNVSF